jgi:2',3'-cyclic-nucleotide 2'-phosphodiesterase/3'-nucleotidase
VFAVVTNNYRASGGGSFPGLDGTQIVLDAPDENREALAQYLQAQNLRPQRRRQLAPGLPVPGVKLRFSGPGGVAHLARYPQVKLVKDNGDGTALYELAP